jgi:hypothetical protein
MTRKRYLPVAVAVLCIFCGFSLVSRPCAYAHEDEAQDHRDRTGDVHAEQTMKDGEVILEHKTEPARITAGTPTTIQLSLKDSKGNPVHGLSLHHDRILHVVIVGQDFSAFAHIHPEDLGPVTAHMKKNAMFKVKYTFPKSGRYLVGVDFAVGEHLFSKHFVVFAGGQPGMGFIKMDLSRGKSFGGLDVTLTPSEEHITAGKEMRFRYLFRESGSPVTDIEPYLSAPMHLSIVSVDLENFIHTHGELPGMHPVGQHEHHMHMTVPKKFGPEIDFHVVFPVPGLYVIFGQVERRGKVVLTNFMVKVE